MDRSFQIDIDDVSFLNPGVVDKDVGRVDFRKRVRDDIRLVMRIGWVNDGRPKNIDADDLMPAFLKEFRDAFPDATGRSGDNHFHALFLQGVCISAR